MSIYCKRDKWTSFLLNSLLQGKLKGGGEEVSRKIEMFFGLGLLISLINCVSKVLCDWIFCLAKFRKWMLLKYVL